MDRLSGHSCHQIGFRFRYYAGGRSSARRVCQRMDLEGGVSAGRVGETQRVLCSLAWLAAEVEKTGDVFEDSSKIAASSSFPSGRVPMAHPMRRTTANYAFGPP